MLASMPLIAKAEASDKEDMASSHLNAVKKTAYSTKFGQFGLLCFRYRHVQWAPRHLNSPAACLFVQQLAHQADIKGNIEALSHWPIVRGIHR